MTIIRLGIIKFIFRVFAILFCFNSHANAYLIDIVTDEYTGDVYYLDRERFEINGDMTMFVVVNNLGSKVDYMDEFKYQSMSMTFAAKCTDNLVTLAQIEYFSEHNEGGKLFKTQEMEKPLIWEDPFNLMYILPVEVYDYACNVGQ